MEVTKQYLAFLWPLQIVLVHHWPGNKPSAFTIPSIPAPSPTGLGEGWVNPHGDSTIKNQQKESFEYIIPAIGTCSPSITMKQKTCGVCELTVSVRRGGSGRKGDWCMQHGGGWAPHRVRASWGGCASPLLLPFLSLSFSFWGQSKPVPPIFVLLGKGERDESSTR